MTPDDIKFILRTSMVSFVLGFVLAALGLDSPEKYLAIGRQTYRELAKHAFR